VRTLDGERELWPSRSTVSHRASLDWVIHMVKLATKMAIFAALLSVILVGTASAQSAVACADFDSQADAQAFLEASGSNDPHDLDRDGDGIACEHLPAPYASGFSGEQADEITALPGTGTGGARTGTVSASVSGLLLAGTTAVSVVLILGGMMLRRANQV
jgi:hypothetical protein